MFGLVNLQGVPKPTYRAYQLLHETGDIRHQTTVHGSGPCAQSVGALAISDDSDPLRRHLDVLIYNHVDDAQTSTACTVKLSMGGGSLSSPASAPKSCTAASVRRIDASNANAYAERI